MKASPLRSSFHTARLCSQAAKRGEQPIVLPSWDPREPQCPAGQDILKGALEDSHSSAVTSSCLFELKAHSMGGNHSWYWLPSQPL